MEAGPGAILDNARTYAGAAPLHWRAVKTLDGERITGLRSATERYTAHEIVRETLRHAILSGELPGGTRLVQADLAVQLNVSTTPVREALRDLASDQLIRFHPHRGAVVHELDMDELQEIYEIRKALEPLAVRLAADRITKAQLKQATELCARMEKEEDAGAWVQANWEFHALLENGAQSPRLANLVKSVQDSSALYVAHAVHLDAARMRKGDADHRKILAAIRSGDGERAATTLERHLDTTLNAILAANAAVPAHKPVRRRGAADRT